MSTVVVVGSVNIDLVAAGGRMPRPGETVMMERFAEIHGGKGGNQAAAAAALGATTHLVGAVGDDDRGRSARADLAARGVHLGGLATVPAPTGVAVILVDDDGENSIAVVAGANAALTPAQVSAALDAIAGPAAVVASLEVPLPAVEAAAAEAHRRGWPMILNPAPARPLPASLVSRCTAVTPNERELTALGGAATLLAAGAGAVVVTRGGAGCEIHTGAGSPVPVPPAPATVVDTTGAGDIFTAALAVALATARPLPDAVRWAAAAGALATEAFGARGSLPTAPAVDARAA
ncbi:PfkB family carbohydrate kinase [Dactylosporangium sucinum]|uniref:Ribokinase n=1 Tax=Dactylosporangium sucinum TaxID=1424081 RepID=A0A917TYS6_9ACTN|nr:PfkB family carbohydrate kinase [Dactylosporangium sucinum]GGM44611.1 ribokinase [Dactylosporangium sucinum]